MNSTTWLYLAPYLLSLLISAGVGFYAWHHRSELGAAAYAVVAWSQAAWTLGYVFEILNPTLAGKVFWDDFQFVCSVGWVVGFVIFTCEYTHVQVKRPRLTFGLLFSPLFVFVALVYTDLWHHLIRLRSRLLTDTPFFALTYDFGPVTIGMALYGYGLFLASVCWLIYRYIRAHALYRTQLGLIVLGNLIPAIGAALTLAGIVQGPYRDISPFTFALGNLLVAWGLFRYRLFDVVPIARDSLIESMNDSVFVCDTSNRLVDLNPAARRALSVGSEAIGQPIDLVFASWPDLLARYRDVEQLHTEVAIDTAQGRQYLDLRIEGVHDRRDHPIGRLIITRNVTPRRLAEDELKTRTAQLEAANDRLRALSQVKDDFVANVSHELRTPLTNLKLQVGLLARHPQQNERAMATIRREIDRLEHMIEGLLALSRFDQEQVEVNFAPFDLNALVEGYVSDRSLLAEQKQISLAFEVDHQTPQVAGDHNLIGQVLSILLTNAINYTPVGGRILVTTHCRADQPCVGFSVADTGPGVQLDEQPRLFTRFFRGYAGRTSEIAGTGLGLALAKEIIDRHLGQIEVESTGLPHQGARFTVWLPNSVSDVNRCADH